MTDQSSLTTYILYYMYVSLNRILGVLQVVGMVGGVGEGVQYVRTLDGSTLHATPQLISVPIALPGAKPGR
jgi:hypothetical protein